MARGVAGFQDSATEVRNAMNALEQELREQLSRYQGEQARAFWQVHNRVQESMTAAGRELDTMSGLVRTSATNYTAGDDEAASDIGGLEGEAASPIFNRLNGN